MTIPGVTEANDFASRLLGLMGRRELGDRRLWFPRCTSLHTCFMRAPLDIVFLDAQRTIVAIHEDVRPWRFVFGGDRAASALESAAGFASNFGLQVGDSLQWR